MTGAFLNAMGILIGALFGLALPKPLSLRTQVFFRSALGALTVYFGLRLVWLSVNGPFLSCLKQMLVAVLALMIGNLPGKLLRLQKVSNRLGHWAGGLIASAPRRRGDGFSACVVLFCAAPLGWLGAVTDGLSGYFYLLAVKAVMDGLAMMSFVKMFRWPVALAAFPVFFFFNGLALLVQRGAKPFLDAHYLTNDVCIAAGLITCTVALVILEVRRVELANYLPALLVAPIFAHWLT